MAVKYGGWWAPKPVDTTWMPEPLALQVAMQQRGQQNNVQLPAGAQVDMARNTADSANEYSRKFQELEEIYTPWLGKGYHKSDIQKMVLQDERAAQLGITGDIDIDFRNVGRGINFHAQATKKNEELLGALSKDPDLLTEDAAALATYLGPSYTRPGQFHQVDPQTLISTAIPTTKKPTPIGTITAPLGKTTIELGGYYPKDENGNPMFDNDGKLIIKFKNNESFSVKTDSNGNFYVTDEKGSKSESSNLNQLTNEMNATTASYLRDNPQDVANIYLRKWGMDNGLVSFTNKIAEYAFSNDEKQNEIAAQYGVTRDNYTPQSLTNAARMLVNNIVRGHTPFFAEETWKAQEPQVLEYYKKEKEKIEAQSGLSADKKMEAIAKLDAQLKHEKDMLNPRLFLADAIWTDLLPREEGSKSWKDETDMSFIKGKEGSDNANLGGASGNYNPWVGADRGKFGSTPVKDITPYGDLDDYKSKDSSGNPIDAVPIFTISQANVKVPGMRESLTEMADESFATSKVMIFDNGVVSKPSIEFEEVVSAEPGWFYGPKIRKNKEGQTIYTLKQEIDDPKTGKKKYATAEYVLQQAPFGVKEYEYTLINESDKGVFQDSYSLNNFKSISQNSGKDINESQPFFESQNYARVTIKVRPSALENEEEYYDSKWMKHEFNYKGRSSWDPGTENVEDFLTTAKGEPEKKDGESTRVFYVKVWLGLDYNDRELMQKVQRVGAKVSGQSDALGGKYGDEVILDGIF